MEEELLEAVVKVESVQVLSDADEAAVTYRRYRVTFEVDVYSTGDVNPDDMRLYIPDPRIISINHRMLRNVLISDDRYLTAVIDGLVSKAKAWFKQVVYPAVLRGRKG